MNIGDTVKIISGPDKGKFGVIDEIWPDFCPYPYHLSIKNSNRTFIPMAESEIVRVEKTYGY